VRVTLLSNAGLVLEHQNDVLLIDLPNGDVGAFSGLPEHEWEKILAMKPPYDRICGMLFTHQHPDHCDGERLRDFQRRHPHIPVYIPDDYPKTRNTVFASFVDRH